MFIYQLNSVNNRTTQRGPFAAGGTTTYISRSHRVTSHPLDSLRARFHDIKASFAPHQHLDFAIAGEVVSVETTESFSDFNILRTGIPDRIVIPDLADTAPTTVLRTYERTINSFRIELEHQDSRGPVSIDAARDRLCRECQDEIEPVGA